MTPESIAKALCEYRNKNGMRWKSRLKELFFSGKNSDEYLQYFRNHYSFYLLDKIKYHTTQREIVDILKMHL